MTSTHFLALAAFAAASSSWAQESVSVRVLFGIADAQPGRWDGSMTVQGATLKSIEAWRPDQGDAITGASWKMSTHPPRLRQAAQQNPQGAVPVANGVFIHLDRASENATLAITTAKGDFEIKLSEIPYGTSVTRLSGNVLADRIPPVTRLTETPDEEDFPAAADGRNGDAWMVYTVFRHNPEHERLRIGVREPITDFAKLKSAPGGDQIVARHYANGVWGQPIPVSEAGGDLYRPAVAVDGGGRAWVFWSSNTKGNFDLFARSIDGTSAGRTVQISKEPGSDVFAVATTDSSGNAWVAWQGWRDGKAAIFAAVQRGDSFSPPMPVSASAGNEWNPAIAADLSGRVTVAWDSYRAGNYDIYMRTATSGGASSSTPNWGPEKAIAASPRYEAYPSIAYDPAGRLWAAYEEGGKGWGKDFGAYNTEGVALYQARVIRIRGFEKDGRAVDLASDVGLALPGTASLKVERAGAQSGSGDGLDPNAAIARQRQPNQAASNGNHPKNTMPRLTIDSSGRMWLAFRTAHPIWWNPLGTVWTENIASFDGAKWAGPVFVNHSDNLLDNRPALVTPKPGEALLIGSSDGRRRFQQVAPMMAGPQLGRINPAEPFNNDLYMSRISLPPASQIQTVTAKPLPTEPRADAVETGSARRPPAPLSLRGLSPLRRPCVG